MSAETFGDRVKKVRLVAKLSQAAIEKHLGKAERSGYLSNIESGARGKRPAAELVDALVELTNASRSYLMTGTGPMFDAKGVVVGAPRERHVERETEVYTSFRTWLAAGGKKLDPEAVEAVQIEAREKRADGDPGFDHWTARYKFFLGKKRGLDELRELSADDLE